MNDIQGVLFDADGTLIDTYDIILTSMRYAVNDVLGCSLDDAELMAGVGTPLYDQMLHFTGGDSARATEITQIYRDHNDGVHDARIRAFSDVYKRQGGAVDDGQMIAAEIVDEARGRVHGQARAGDH